ncbi:WbqC family protein [soil metagenome]
MNFKEYLIIENQYFPVVNWFKYSFKKKYIILPACETYQKMSFRNRTVICGSNGVINLSVPIENGRNQRAAFKDVKIAFRDNWQSNHWRSIVSCYSKSPFFDYYSNGLENIFRQKHTYLFDLNLDMLKWLKKILKFPAEIIVAEEDTLSVYGEKADDALNKWLPKNFQQQEDFIRYAQVFEDRIGFQPNVSILDLLFNMGPSAAKLLQ